MPFLGFLRRGLDHLDAGDRLGQPGVHLAKAPALLARDRVELVDIAAQGKEIGDHKEHRRHQQLGAQKGDEDQRRNDADHRLDDQRDARVHHRIELAHIVGRPGHDVAHPLAVVEGLAFAQQADIQLLARIALHALTERLHRPGVGDIQHPAHEHQPQDRQGDREQAAGVGFGLQHLIESHAR